MKIRYGVLFCFFSCLLFFPACKLFRKKSDTESTNFKLEAKGGKGKENKKNFSFRPRPHKAKDPEVKISRGDRSKSKKIKGNKKGFSVHFRKRKAKDQDSNMDLGERSKSTKVKGSKKGLLRSLQEKKGKGPG